jgi:hypothetical protein
MNALDINLGEIMSNEKYLKEFQGLDKRLASADVGGDEECVWCG